MSYLFLIFLGLFLAIRVIKIFFYRADLHNLSSYQYELQAHTVKDEYEDRY